MKNTNTNEFKAKLREYLLPAIHDKLESYGFDPQTVEKPFSSILGIARGEVPHEFDRHGEQGGMEYWLEGLGLGIDFYYCDIIRACEQMHECKLTDREKETVCENWWRFMASKICQFARKEGASK